MAFAPSPMILTSSAFADGEAIPARYTGVAEDLSPALGWADAPAEAKAFALICHDPDAPKLAADGLYGFVHWVLYNIPGSATELVEGCSDYTAGVNDFGNAGYGGPMPPEGHGTHHYYFWLMALDTELNLPAGLTQTQLLAQIEPHVIGMNRLRGSFVRD